MISGVVVGSSSFSKEKAVKSLKHFPGCVLFEKFVKSLVLEAKIGEIIHCKDNQNKLGDHDVPTSSS